MARYRSSTAELDQAERRWWEDNGDLEEDYCWVQTPELQRFLRRPYLRPVTDRARAGVSVLELGCGTGWLSLLLARLGCGRVVGLDFSPDQVERARRGAAAAGLSDRVDFALAGADDPFAGETFDIVVMHAFLHHLSSAEIDEALAGAADRLSDAGTLVVVEPVHYAQGRASEPWTLQVLRKLESLPRALHHRGLRQMTPAEIEIRERLGSRAVGDGQFGPSPKELPFAPEEVRRHLGRNFTLVDHRPALCMAHLVAQDLLIASLSQPRLWRLVRWPILAVARTLDERLMRRGRLPSTVWVFETFVCAKQAPVA